MDATSATSTDSATGALESRCPACGSTFSGRVAYPRRASVPLDFSGIELCSGCGLGMAVPRHTQSALDAFYASGAYWTDTVGASRMQTLHERNQCRHRVELALEHMPRRTQLRVLDVGAGHGWTAYWLDRLAGAAIASFDFIEPDERLSREIAGRSTAGNTRRVDSLDRASGPYDLVFLNHVLEHVADPVATVRSIRALLAPEGIAYFEMPHADHRFKADVFPHTWFFTPEALSHLARRTGMAEVLRESFGRFPTSSVPDLVRRAAYRVAAMLDLRALAGFFDDRVWRYAPRHDGMWLRWIVRPS